MKTDHLNLAALAEICALRNLVVQAICLKLLSEPDPLHVIALIEDRLTAIPTQPAQTDGALDPAMSDMLSALTDERTRSLMGDIRGQIATLIGA